MQRRDKPKHWKVVYSPSEGERKSPFDFIDDKEEGSSIFSRLETLEHIKIPREWPGQKTITYDRLMFHQVTIGSFRVYIHLDTRDGRNYAVVCHACRKVGRKAKKKDLNRVVTHIRNYLSSS